MRKTLGRSLVFFTLIALGLCCQEERVVHAQADADKGIKELQGKWRAVQMQTAGIPATKEVLEKARLEIKDDAWIWLSGGPVDVKSRIRLDPSKSPKEIDIIMLDGPGKGSTIPGIYALEKGRLRVCLSHTKDRPEDFQSRRGELRELLVLERVGEHDTKDKAAHEAEKFFHGMEQKVRAAKTLQLRFDAIIIRADAKKPDDKKKVDIRKWHFKGSVILGEGDKFRAEYEGNLFGQENKRTFVSDGTHWTSFGYTKEPGEDQLSFRGPGTERTPKAIGAYLRPGLPRDGFVLCFITDRRRHMEPDNFTIADFKVAGEEKIGERNTQVIQYSVKPKGKDPSFGTPLVNATTMKLSMTVWLDTKTKLPVKLAMKCDDPHFNAITENYSEFTVDGKVDAKLFELPQ